MKSLLETAMNTRDLGGYPCAGGAETRRGVLLRSDKITEPSRKDLAFLRERGIGTVIDLRTDFEAEDSPSGLEDAGFEYYRFPITEGSSVPRTAAAVPLSYLCIARDPNMPKVFRTLAAAKGGVLFGCSAGKDRTGVVSAVILLLCGADDEDIVDNYMLTKECCAPLWKIIREVFPGYDMSAVIPREEFMSGFLRLFREAYGTAENYLLALGLTSEELAAVKRKLCGA